MCVNSSTVISTNRQKCVNAIAQPTLLTSWRIRRKWTSCFLKHTTSCSMEFRSDLSMTRSSDDELSICECRLSCWRCLRCSLSVVFDGVLRLCMLSSDRGLSEPFWLKGELLLFCRRRFSKRVARAGSCDLEIRKFPLKLMYPCLHSIFIHHNRFEANIEDGKIRISIPVAKQFFSVRRKSINSDSVTESNTHKQSTGSNNTIEK